MDVILMNLGLLVLGLLWLLSVFTFPFTSAYVIAFLFMHFQGIANYHVEFGLSIIHVMIVVAIFLFDIFSLRERFLALRTIK